jgi:hypothetical protein
MSSSTPGVAPTSAPIATPPPPIPDSTEFEEEKEGPLVKGPANDDCQPVGHDQGVGPKDIPPEAGKVEEETVDPGIADAVEPTKTDEVEAGKAEEEGEGEGEGEGDGEAAEGDEEGLLIRGEEITETVSPLEDADKEEEVFEVDIEVADPVRDSAEKASSGMSKKANSRPSMDIWYLVVDEDEDEDDEGGHGAGTFVIASSTDACRFGGPSFGVLGAVEGGEEADEGTRVAVAPVSCSSSASRSEDSELLVWAGVLLPDLGGEEVGVLDPAFGLALRRFFFTTLCSMDELSVRAGLL